MIQDVFLDAVGEIDERYIAEAHASAVRTSPRLRQAWILAACVAALALLTGAVWAAVRWFRISDAPGVVIETRWRNEEVDQPQNLIRFEDPGPGNYVGFLVNGRRKTQRPLPTAFMTTLRCTVCWTRPKRIRRSWRRLSAITAPSPRTERSFAQGYWSAARSATGAITPATTRSLSRRRP